MQKERLLKLWKKFQKQMTSEELNNILERGICFSKIEIPHRILVTGMNPSFRQGDVARKENICEYNYQGIVEGGGDRYFLAHFPGGVQTRSSIHGFAEFPGNGSGNGVEVLQ